MGTKRTNWTNEDSLQLPHSPATPDRGYQSNERISREARSQAGPKIQVKQERGREELKAREMDRMWDKPREGRRDTGQDQSERERYAQFKGRADEMYRERDRRREEGRYTNGRAPSTQQYEGYREREKGDTFPRTVRPYNERERITRHSGDKSSERLAERGNVRMRELNMIDIEREKDRERAKKMDKDTQRYREIERQRENERRRIREEMKRNAGRRLEEEYLDQMRLDPGKRERRGERPTEIRDSDQKMFRRQENDRYRDRPRDRAEWFHSPETRRITGGDKDNYSDREERDKRRRTGQKERHRYTKSEGDTDGEKEKVISREDDVVSLRLASRNGIDNERDRTRDKLRERERRREVERQKERERRKGKETALQFTGREGNKEQMMERYKERDISERDWASEDRGINGQRDQLRGTEDRRKEKELNERMRRESERDKAHIPPAEREMDLSAELSDRPRLNCYEEEMTGRKKKTRQETDRRIREEAHISRECIPGRDVEGDHQSRRIKDSFDKEERTSTSESDREKRRSEYTAWELRKEEAQEGSEKEEIETEREKEQEKSESKKRPHRKMWLEPRSGREKTPSLQEDFKEREQARERYAHRYKEQKTSIGEEEMSTAGMNEGVTILLEDSLREVDSPVKCLKVIDSENLEEIRVSDETTFDREAWLEKPWQTEAENVVDNIEGSDREEEQRSDSYINSDGEEESEGVWEEWRDKVTSGDDGFVTVSSGADEDEREDRFEDCTEFWEGTENKSLARQSPTSTQQKERENETRMTKERTDRTVTFFCVVGQTLPRSGSNKNPLLDHMEQEETSQGSSWEMGGVGGDQDEAPHRDSEAESTSTGYELSLSEEDMSSGHDTKSDNAELEQMPKEVTTSKDLVIRNEEITEKDIETYPTESIETLNQTEDIGNAQVKMTDGEKQAEGQNQMESSCHLEETEILDDRKRFSAAPHVKWAKNVLSEILGSEEDKTLVVTEPSTHTEQAGDGAPDEAENQGDSPLYGIVQKPRKHSHDRKLVDSELQHFKQENTKTDVLAGKEILLQVEGQSEEEEDLERLSVSPDLHSLSSDNEVDKEESNKPEKKQKKKAVWKLLGSNSFKELGSEVWGRKAGIRKSLPKHNEEEESEEGVGRDRRPRIFATDDDINDLSVSWGELDLRNNKSKLSRTKMRNSKFYNSQLYQQYNEVVQNRELIHQSHSDASSLFGEAPAFSASSSPAHSPTLARRPLPPLPAVVLPHSMSHTSSVSSGSGSLAIPHDTRQKPPSPRMSRFASSPILWQDLQGVRNNPDLNHLSKDERRLQEVRFEVVTSESSYCSSLEIVVEHFVKCKQLNLLLTSQDKNWLFSKLSEVRAISHSFFSQLEERVESDIMHFTVCDIITKHCPRFRAVYVPYLTNQSYQDKTYQRLMNENSGFRHIVEKLEQSPKCQRLPLRSFLILPFQRITRLKLLVQNIVKRTAPKTVDEAQAIKAMKLLDKMIQDSNDSISQMKNIESLVSLNAKVDFECKTLPLISQSRRLVKEGPVTELRDFSLKEKERSAYIHLFNDYLLLSLPKEGGRFAVIDHAPVSELKAENCQVKLLSLQKSLFRLHIAQKALLLRAETQADKLRWISALSRPHPEIDFSAAQDFTQMQCIKAFVAQQPDELSLEKADILLVHQSDGWVEVTRLSDRCRGWVPESHLETIVSEKARERNLIDALKITAATATV